MKVNGQLKNALLEIVDKASYVADKCGRIFFDKECKAMMLDNGDDCLRLQDSRDLPIGTIIMWGTTNIPDHYLICDGTEISRTALPELFSEIGVTYGAGDGTTTFNIPDYRGQFLRAVDSGAGCDVEASLRTDRGDGTGGDNVGTKQADQFESHTHTYPDRYSIVGYDSDNDNDNRTWRGYTDFTRTSNATGGAETRPKNVSIYFLIKVK